MRVIICGGRSFDDYEMLERELDALHAQHRFTHVIHGAAKGADSFGEHWAQSRHLEVEKVPAHWRELGKKAGAVRNAEMLTRKPQLVIAFKGGKGTANMVRQAEAAGVPVIRIGHDEFASR